MLPFIIWVDEFFDWKGPATISKSDISGILNSLAVAFIEYTNWNVCPLGIASGADAVKLTSSAFVTAVANNSREKNKIFFIIITNLLLHDNVCFVVFVAVLCSFLFFFLKVDASLKNKLFFGFFMLLVLNSFLNAIKLFLFINSSTRA